jgi:hypothetical protein
MAGKSGFRGYPKHLPKPKGIGIRQCEASGFMRTLGKEVKDVRQGLVAREFADITPGFGTKHPQDVVQLGEMNDPKPVPEARPEDKRNLSKQDLAMSDQEIRASIVEGRAPRIGY